MCGTHGRSSRFSIVWRFFFGISFDKDLVAVDRPQLNLHSIVDKFLKSGPINGSLLCQCAFEANCNEIDIKLVDTLGDFGSVCPTSTLDCVAMIRMISKLKSYSTDVLNLHLRQCRLGEREVILLGEALAGVDRHMKVQRLDLHENHLNDASISYLFTSASSALKHLADFNIGSNCLSGEVIALFMSYTSYLKRLNLCYNPLETSSLKLLADSLQSSLLPNLRSLDLKGSLSPDADVNSVLLALLVQALVNCSELQSLDLSSNNLGVPGALAIGEYLPPLTKSSKWKGSFSLYLNEVNLGNEGLSAFLQGPFHGNKMENLELNNNNINAAGLISLLEAIQDQKFRLSSLSLAGNPLGPQGVLAIWERVVMGSANLIYRDANLR